MKKKVAVHSLCLFACIAFSFFWTTDETLNYYSLQLTAILLIVLLLTHRFLAPHVFKLTESIITTLAVILIVSATGHLSSPLFFLNYFLLFELSFLLEPPITLFLSVLLIIYYLLTQEILASPYTLLEYLAFPFMTPLAYIFGKLYQKILNQKKEIQHLSKKVEDLEEELVEEELENK